MKYIKKDFKTKEQIFNYITNEYSKGKDLVIIRGSSAYGEIKEYFDLDIEIYSKKSRKPIYEFLFYNNQIILLTIYFYKYEKGNEIRCPENVKILKGTYNDKINSIFQSEISKKDSYTIEELIIRKRQLIIDFFFKYMRSNNDELLLEIQNKMNFK